RDLDVLRAVLQQPSLSYLGFSYGTFLGAIYAEHFPDTVGRLVLDGAIDPALNYTEITQGQIAAFDRAYRSYLEDCLSSADCPFTGDVDDAVNQTVQLVHQLADTPVDSGDPERPVTERSEERRVGKVWSCRRGGHAVMTRAGWCGWRRTVL